MNKFIAHLIQASEGCEHTIGCGHTLIKLKSTTKKAALSETKRMVIDGYRPDMENGKIILYEVCASENIPLKDWYDEAEIDDEYRKLKEKQEELHAEYERLYKRFKRKFG